MIQSSHLASFRIRPDGYAIYEQQRRAEQVIRDEAAIEKVIWDDPLKRFEILIERVARLEAGVKADAARLAASTAELAQFREELAKTRVEVIALMNK